MATPVKGNQQRIPIAQKLAADFTNFSTLEQFSREEQDDLIYRIGEEVFGDQSAAGKGGTRGFFGNLPKKVAEELLAATQALMARGDIIPELVEYLESLASWCVETIRIRNRQSPIWRAENM